MTNGRTVRAASALAVLFGGATIASAQTGPDLLLGPFNEGTNAVVRGDTYFLNNGRTDNDAGAKLDIYNTQGRFKIDFDAVSPTISKAQPRAGYEFTHLHLDSNDAALPDQFTDVSVGFGIGIVKEGPWLAGLSFAVGYASASAFDDGNAYYGKADLAVGYTINEKERIGFILDYDGNRTFLPDVPLPGFVYSRKLNDQISIRLGFPYTDVEYKPSDKVTINLRYVLPDGGEADVEYAFTPEFRVYGGFSQQNEAFHWDELGNGDRRVIFSQSRAEVGVRGRYETFGTDLAFTLAAGYAFNTKFEVGWDSRDTDSLADLSDEPYVRAAFELKF